MIHAASFFQNGVAAVRAGRELGVPVIYEMRGLSILKEVSEASRSADPGVAEILTAHRLGVRTRARGRAQGRPRADDHRQPSLHHDRARGRSCRRSRSCPMASTLIASRLWRATRRLPRNMGWQAASSSASSARSRPMRAWTIWWKAWPGSPPKDPTTAAAGRRRRRLPPAAAGLGDPSPAPGPGDLHRTRAARPSRRLLFGVRPHGLPAQAAAGMRGDLADQAIGADGAGHPRPMLRRRRPARDGRRWVSTATASRRATARRWPKRCWRSRTAASTPPRHQAQSRAWIEANRDWRQLARPVTSLYRELYLEAGGRRPERERRAPHPWPAAAQGRDAELAAWRAELSPPGGGANAAARPRLGSGRSRGQGDHRKTFQQLHPSTHPLCRRRCRDRATELVVVTVCPAGQRLLDVGPSVGILINAVARKGNYRGTGWRSTSGLIAAFLNPDKRIDYRQMSVTALDFPDGHFDTVCCLGPLARLPEAALKGAIRFPLVVSVVLFPLSAASGSRAREPRQQTTSKWRSGKSSAVTDILRQSMRPSGLRKSGGA